MQEGVAHPKYQRVGNNSEERKAVLEQDPDCCNITPYQVHCVWCRSDVNLDRQRQTTYKTRAWETYRNSDIHTDERCIGSSYVTCSRGAWEVLRHHVKRAGVNPSAQLRLTAWRAGAVEIQRTKSRAKQARRNATAWMQQQ
ncbi:hypothetical protein B0H14DRAFT_2585445 [Mycena olivaceomarginata]|nr:hypothetical protein B0H14DRAFT_2585445 [Mycena olivaceomarginata]